MPSRPIDSEGGQLGRGVIPLGWMVLGMLLVVAFYGGSPAWLPLAGTPWLAGAACLTRARWRADVARVWGETARGRVVQTCAVIWLGVLGLIALVLSPSAALLTIAWLGAAALVAGRLEKARLLRQGLIGCCLTAVALSVALGIGEAIFQMPALQSRLGLPGERRARNEAYDRAERENVLGLRSRHETVSKEPGTFRILALGDSFTWGDMIPAAENTWPALLESKLQSRWPGAQVINMGRRGFTTANEAELLSRLGWQMCPDLVIVQYFWNDVLPSGPDFDRVDSRYLYSPRALLPQRFRSGLVENSALSAFLDQHFNRLRRRLSSARKLRDLYDEDFDGWKQMRAAMAYLAASSDTRSVPVLFLLYPAFPQGNWTVESHPMRDIYRRVAGLAESEGLHVLDLTRVFADAGGDWARWRATPYDGHPGPAAQALAAAAMAAFLENRGWLPATSSGAIHPAGSRDIDGPACQPVDRPAFAP